MSPHTIISSRDQDTIVNALSVAASQFSRDSVEMRTIAVALREGQAVPMFAKGMAGAKAAENLARTFDQQEQDTWRLFREIREARHLVIEREEEDL